MGPPHPGSVASSSEYSWSSPTVQNQLSTRSLSSELDVPVVEHLSVASTKEAEADAELIYPYPPRNLVWAQTTAIRPSWQNYFVPNFNANNDDLRCETLEVSSAADPSFDDFLDGNDGSEWLGLFRQQNAESGEGWRLEEGFETWDISPSLTASSEARTFPFPSNPTVCGVDEQDARVASTFEASLDGTGSEKGGGPRGDIHEPMEPQQQLVRESRHSSVTSSNRASSFSYRDLGAEMQDNNNPTSPIDAQPLGSSSLSSAPLPPSASTAGSTIEVDTLLPSVGTGDITITSRATINDTLTVNRPSNTKERRRASNHPSNTKQRRRAGNRPSSMKQGRQARNRVAAANFRARSRVTYGELYSKTASLKLRHAELTFQSKLLLDEALHLRSAVLSHAYCGDKDVDSYIMSRAAKIGSTGGVQ